jgi:hypothetical protein
MPAWYFGCKYWYKYVTSGRVVNDVIEKDDMRTTLWSCRQPDACAHTLSEEKAWSTDGNL